MGNRVYVTGDTANSYIITSTAFVTGGVISVTTMNTDLVLAAQY